MFILDGCTGVGGLLLVPLSMFLMSRSSQSVFAASVYVHLRFFLNCLFPLVTRSAVISYAMSSHLAEGRYKALLLTMFFGLVDKYHFNLLPSQHFAFLEVLILCLFPCPLTDMDGNESREVGRINLWLRVAMGYPVVLAAFVPLKYFPFVRYALLKMDIGWAYFNDVQDVAIWQSAALSLTGIDLGLGTPEWLASLAGYFSDLFFQNVQDPGVMSLLDFFFW